MRQPISRRGFLAASAAMGALSARTFAADAPPLEDLHVHLDNSSLEAVLTLSTERGVKFGVVEHAGTEENRYPVVLSNDEELGRYLDRLEGKPVHKGVQAEWIDWTGCFSKAVLARLDFVLTDAMTFPAPDGRRTKLWEQGADWGDPGTFMDRYMDWYVRILAEQPIDVLANVSWLPEAFAADYDAHWTDARIERVVSAAVERNVALEISSGFELPDVRFLRIAKAAGAKFTFGLNGRYPNMGKLDYSIGAARALGLRREDMYVPTTGGARAGRSA